MSADPPPTSRSTRASQKRAEQPATAKRAKTLESDGGFKFKRSKAEKRKEAAPVIVTSDVTLPPPSSPVLSCPAEPSFSSSEPQSSAEAVPLPLKSSIPQAAPTLDGVAWDVLLALFEECEERKQNLGSSPAKMRLAIEECMRELRRQGVTHLPPIVSERSSLQAREAVLERRLSELQLAKRSWDAAALYKAHLGSQQMRVEAAPDSKLIEGLGELPDIEGALSRVRTAAELCADQLEGVLRRSNRLLLQSATDGQELAQAAHKAAFKDLKDVEAPQLLLRCIAAS
ncbi:MAG: hypothetical protein SGPRY_007093 [Prymnesium sp.]